MRKSVVEMKDGLAKNAGAINCLTQEKNKPAIAQTTAGSSSKETEELLLAALLAAGVHSGLEGGARNELRHLSGRNRDGGAGGGIAAGAGRTILKLERTEADERQRLAALDGSHHFIDHRAKNAVGFCLGNGVLFGNLFDKFHAIHRLSPYVFGKRRFTDNEDVRFVIRPLDRLSDGSPSGQHAIVRAGLCTLQRATPVKQRNNDSPRNHGMQYSIGIKHAKPMSIL